MLEPGISADVRAFCVKYATPENEEDVPNGYVRFRAGPTDRRGKAKTQDMPSKEEVDPSDVERFVLNCLDKAAMALEDRTLNVWIEYIDRNQSPTNARAWKRLNDAIGAATSGNLTHGATVSEAYAASMFNQSALLVRMVETQHMQINGLFDNIGDLMMRTATAEARLAVEDDDGGMMGAALEAFAQSVPQLVQVMGAAYGASQSASTPMAEDADQQGPSAQERADALLASARSSVIALVQTYQSDPDTMTPAHAAALVQLRDVLLNQFPVT